mgnify:CR=1 FL=1
MKELIVWLALIAFLYFAWTSSERQAAQKVVLEENSAIINNIDEE